MTCVFLAEGTAGPRETPTAHRPDPEPCPPLPLQEAPRCGLLSTGRLLPPVRVVEPRVSLGRQSADLLPVRNQLLSLHLDLSGAQRVGLLQAVGLRTQGFDLETHSIRTALTTLSDTAIELAAFKTHLVL